MPVHEMRNIPIIRLGRNLLVSIQTDLEDEIALRLRDDIAHEIVRTGATGLVIDVTAIDIMDSYTARVIDEIGRIAALMGASAVLVGLRPAIAITLVEMGMEMGNVRTALNLEAGLALLGRDDRDDPAWEDGDGDEVVYEDEEVLDDEHGSRDDGGGGAPPRDAAAAARFRDARDTKRSEGSH